MKICGISDMHGNLNFSVDKCDVLAICGDILPLDIQTYSKSSKKWVAKSFLPWCDEQPCNKVILIGGNHDFFIQNHEDELRELVNQSEKVVYLNRETYEVDGVKFYGTPYCHIFGRWAFMVDDELQDEMYNKDLETIGNVDVVLSHDSPYGTSDVLLQKSCPWANGKHIGCEPLARFIEKLQPKISLHGHLHSTNHEMEELGITKVYNVSLLDEFYKMVYSPLYLSV